MESLQSIQRLWEKTSLASLRGKAVALLKWKHRVLKQTGFSALVPSNSAKWIAVFEKVEASKFYLSNDTTIRKAIDKTIQHFYKRKQNLWKWLFIKPRRICKPFSLKLGKVCAEWFAPKSIKPKTFENTKRVFCTTVFLTVLSVSRKNNFFNSKTS